MIYRSFNGLRYEAITPSRYVFRLGKNCGPIDLSFDGVVWRIESNGRRSCFVNRHHATQWMAEAVAVAEARYETNFTYAHMIEDQNA